MIKKWTVGSIVWVLVVYLFCAMVLPDHFMRNLRYTGLASSEFRGMVFWQLIPPCLVGVVIWMLKGRAPAK